MAATVELSKVPVHISARGAYIYVKDLTEKQANYIEKSFTIRNKNILGFWDIIKCYSYWRIGQDRCILIPRFGPRVICEKIRLKPHNRIEAGQTARFTITAEFRGNQRVVFNELMATYFNAAQVQKGLAGTIINLEPGQGKTYLGMQVIAHLGLKTFIVTHNELILKQWADAIAQCMAGARVGLWYGKRKTANADSDIIISIINSAINYEGWDNIGLCIFDEAHLYCSKGRAEVFDKCQSTYMLGLTATPEDRKERQDGTYKIIQWHIGPVLDAAQVDGYTVEDIPFQGRVRMVKYRGHPDYTETLINERLEIVSNSKMIAQLAQDPYRIKLVVRLTQEAIRETGINLFIFANRRSYLEDIHARLVEIHGTAPLFFTNAVEEAAIMTIMGNSTQDAVAAAEAHSRIILTTYQYFGVGKSIPRMNAMILATPFRTGSKQYIGRIFRLGSDYSIVRNIIDIVDWDTTLKSQWYSRKKYYAEKEYPIIAEQVQWNEFHEVATTAPIVDTTTAPIVDTTT